MYLHFTAPKRLTVDLTKGESIRFGLVQRKITSLRDGEGQGWCEVDKLRVMGNREPHRALLTGYCMLVFILGKKEEEKSHNVN